MMKNKHNRELDIFSDHQKIQYMLEKHLNEAVMFLQGFDPPYKVKITSYTAPDHIIVNLGEFQPEENQKITLFRILGRYMHLECIVLDKGNTDGFYHLRVAAAAIAKKARSSLRLPVLGDEIFISNIRTSKHTIDASLYNIPTSVKVNFDSTMQPLKLKEDFINIDVFKERGSILHEINKTQKVLLVNNCEDPKSFEPLSESYIDYEDFLDDELTNKIHEYRNANIKSEVIVPIIYYTHDNSSIPLGYIQVQSKSQHFDESKVKELEEIAEQMVERIRDSNTVLIQERQQVINISKGGIKVMIEHEQLRQYLQRMNGFTFDVFFKGQSPVTVYGTIRAMYVNRNHSLILGIQISGMSSTKKDMRHFEDNLELLEKKFKADLANKRAMK